MKKIVLAIVAIIGVNVLVSAQAKFSEVAKMETETLDQGKIEFNKPQPAKFILKNISNAPIIIESASPTCGCTVSDYTKTPILPGKTGYIMATFNAASMGRFTKPLNLKISGVDEVKQINLTGDVLSAEDYAKWKAENMEKPTIAVNPVTPAKTPTKANSKKIAPKKPVSKKPSVAKA